MAIASSISELRKILRECPSTRADASYKFQKAFAERMEGEATPVDLGELLTAIIENDGHGVLVALADMSLDALLLKAGIIEAPVIKGAPVHIPATDGSFRQEDFASEYCPFCGSEVVIYSKGVTACPECGKPLAPCSMCEECNYDKCPYGCTGGDTDEFKRITNQRITQAEIDWYLRHS